MTPLSVCCKFSLSPISNHSMPEFSEDVVNDMPPLIFASDYIFSPTTVLEEKRLLLDERIRQEGFELKWLPVDCGYMWIYMGVYDTPFGMHDESIPFDPNIFEGADRDFDVIAEQVLLATCTCERPEGCVEEGCQDTMVMGLHPIVEEDCEEKGMTMLYYNIQCAKHGMWLDNIASVIMS